MSTFSDREIDDICEGLKQSNAKIRDLKSLCNHAFGKPNGPPLVRLRLTSKSAIQRCHVAPYKSFNVVSLQMEAAALPVEMAPRGYKEKCHG